MEQELLTFREQRSLHPFLVGSCCSCRSIICVHVLARFQLKTLFGLNLLPYILQGVMAGVISEAGTACLSGAPQFTRGF